jgi:hypothetical protein
MASSWRVAKSLDKLLAQINAAYPNRSKSSDGSIGDTAHSQTKSEHNPDSHGVVRARDYTHDPAHGFDSYKLAETLRLNRDHRILYVISNGRIFSSEVSPWVWRKYTGSNKHDHHVHVSVVSNPALYDSVDPWVISGTAVPDEEEAPSSAASFVVQRPLLKSGSKGANVKILQTALGFKGDDVDGIFGKKTVAAVKDFQEGNGLVADGKVGPYTWEAIDKATAPKA